MSCARNYHLCVEPTTNHMQLVDKDN